MAVRMREVLLTDGLLNYSKSVSASQVTNRWPKGLRTPGTRLSENR